MSVTPEAIQHVARLARIRLEGQALSQLAHDLDRIIGYVQRLADVQTDQVEPTSHVLPLADVLRPDVPAACLSPETISTLSKSAMPPFVTVPKVIEG
jgi:aspartyl-tRNA(Asn)/glutamyl-tRNA(Gln) amidotransferase subunit C